MEIYNEDQKPLDILLESFKTLKNPKDFGIIIQEISGICDQSKGLTIPRSKKRKNDNVEMSSFLFSKYLEQQEFLKIMQFLQTKRMYLKDYLNSGGEADVYQGYFLDINDNQIEKVFRIVKGESEAKILEIKKEYERVKSIKKSYNLIEYKGLIQVDNILIFVMEKYEFSLKDFIEFKKISPQLFWLLTFDLINGLIELRIHDIIHSDIKPGNIFVDISYEKEEIKCIYGDFGMSLKLKNRQLQIKENKGYTPKYCSPEHLNDELLSYASDMYSLGLVLLEISKQLEDKEVQKSFEVFLEANILQKDPKKRIQLENVIPTLILKKELKIQYDLGKIISYLKSQNSNKYLIVNRTIHLRMVLSFEIVMAIFIYIINNKQELISFKSITDVDFQFFSNEELLYFFNQIVLHETILPIFQRQKYEKLLLQIAESLPITHKNSNRLMAYNLLIGSNYFNQNMNELSLQYCKKGLKILEEHFPTNMRMKFQFFNLIGQNQVLLNEAEIGVQSMLKSIEFLKLCDHKNAQANLIRTNIQLSIFLEYVLKKPEEGLKYCKEGVNIFLKNKQNKDNGLEIFDQLGHLQLISLALEKLGQYTEKFEITIQILRIQNNILEIADNIEEDSKQLLIILGKMNSDQIKHYLDSTLRDENNDFVKKLVLFEFFIYFFNHKQYQEAVDVYLVFRNIKEKLPFSFQLQEKITMMILFKLKNDEVEEAYQIYKIFNLIQKSQAPPTFHSLNMQINFCEYLIEKDNMKEIGKDIFKKLEVQSKIMEFEEPQKIAILHEIEKIKILLQKQLNDNNKKE